MSCIVSNGTKSTHSSEFILASVLCVFDQLFLPSVESACHKVMLFDCIHELIFFRAKHEHPGPAQSHPGLEQGGHCKKTHLCVRSRVAGEYKTQCQARASDSIIS